jgi:hypothetical protein
MAQEAKVLKLSRLRYGPSGFLAALHPPGCALTRSCASALMCCGPQSSAGVLIRSRACAATMQGGGKTLLVLKAQSNRQGEHNSLWSRDIVCCNPQSSAGELIRPRACRHSPSETTSSWLPAASESAHTRIRQYFDSSCYRCPHVETMMKPQSKQGPALPPQCARPSLALAQPVEG